MKSLGTFEVYYSLDAYIVEYYTNKEKEKIFKP